MSEDKPTQFDVQPEINFGFETPQEAHHELMGKYYDGINNAWVIAKMLDGRFRVLSIADAFSREDVADHYNTRENVKYSTTLVSWWDGKDFITIPEGA